MAIRHDLLLIGGGRVATALLGLVAIRIATTILSPEQFGELSLLVAVQLFCGMFLINPVEQHIYRNAHPWWNDRTLLQRISVYKFYGLAVGGVGAIFAVAISHQHSLGEAFWISLTMLFMVVATTWNGITVPMLNMLGFRAESVFWGVSTAIFSVISSVLLAQWNNLAVSWFAGQAIGLAVGALGAWDSLRRKAPSEKCQKKGGQPLLAPNTITTYCIPLAVATGLMWLQMNGYRFVVEHYWGLAELGYMSVGFLMTSQIWGMFEYLVTQLFYPAFYRHINEVDENRNRKILSDLLNILGPISVVLVGVTILSASALLYVLVDQQYHAAVTFVFFGAAIECCRVLGNFFARAAHITRKTRSLAVPYALGGGGQLMLLLIAGWVHASMKWVGASLVVGGMVMLVSMAISMHKQVHYSLDMYRWMLSGLILVILVSAGLGLPSIEGIGGALSLLAVAGVVTVVTLYLLVWKSPALKRLLEVDAVHNRGTAYD